ncbi:hypothetical protein [Acanthopleuribacter pedis]|uniref:Uncharacterized protein n=1 Tax=Acanthopleuribacter pedis TaxID=442870 RepID=A0A8J7Q510_9BACT|nr:hypothetical protein [Acanthopleuribacter pedis]MBO1320542.1 hypothetical protein [Acanthopleuribacter pedis]
MSSIDNAYRLNVQSQPVAESKPTENSVTQDEPRRFSDDDGFEFSADAQQLSALESNSPAVTSADDPLIGSYPLPPSHP